ncbi:glycoside hydrolase family 92 protein [Fodinicola feengrottensis]|uniref:glycoside hydrolase family 92 protein n=1 Tax=Fodinicola feengrottensis TaxID=435914 RepID=UPI0024421DED|nr:glycoside hydrolase family 92 protein [Fodinicola feengrottensis]
MRTATAKAWRNELRSIDISAPNPADATVFYTALYHVLLQPLTGTDIDGRYRGLDKQIHRAIGWTYYQYFSLWDTYRGQNQLLALLRPDRARDIARTILAIHDQGGWLPRWVYADYETNTMTGDPVTPYLVDLWRFGALHGMESKAFAALKQNATETPPASLAFSGRSGNASYLSRGFVQYDEKFPHKGQDVDPQHGASATFEYSLADCSLSIMAAGLGKTADAATLAQRGQNYQKLWDSGTTDRGFTGFPRPRTADGTFYTPATGPYDPTSQSGFHEGTAWQYQWMDQQDVPGLLALMGGKENAAARLDTFFDYPDLVTDPSGTAHTKWVVGPYSYYNQFRYNPNNEPDLHTPWMYDLVGQPWKTSAAVRAAQTLFVNAPNGVTGNDDLGEMSAWYVLSALGMYPATPGTGQFLVNAPRFPYAAVHLRNGHTVTISAPGTDPTQLQYISAAKVNGHSYPKTYLSLAGMPSLSVSYQVTSDATQATWATSPSATPLSPCTSQ